MPKPLRKRDREACWAARDEYYQCLDTYITPHWKINVEKKILDFPEGIDIQVLKEKCATLSEM